MDAVAQRRELALAHGRVGTVLQAQGKLEEALERVPALPHRPV